MRNRRLAVVASLVAFGALASYACVSSSDDTPSTPDAASLGDDAAAIDSAAPGSDAGTDALSDAPVDASDAAETGVALDAGDASAEVTVLVTHGSTGLPESGLTVVFQDATGAVIGTATTDASGSAAQSATGGQVTVLFGTPSAPRLVTIVGVQPGDQLHVTDDDPSFATQGTETITSVPATPPANTTQYFAQTGTCTGTFPAPPETLSLYAGFGSSCVAHGKFPLLVTAEDVDGNALGFAFQNANTIVADGGVPIALTGAWSALGTMAFNLSHAPTSGVFAELDEVASGVPIWSTSAAFGDPDSGLASVAVPSHPGYPDFVQPKVTVSSADPWYLQMATRIAAPGATGTVTFDLSTNLPAIQSTSITTANPARPIVSWTATGSLASAAGTLVVLSWADNGGISGGWTLVVPASTMSVQLPALPADAGTWIPPAQPDFNGPALWVVTADGILSTYAQARAALQPLYGIDPTSFSGAVPLLPANGTIRVSFWSE